MVKKGYVECEKCKKVMKKTAKRGHKCVTVDPLRPIKCLKCSKEVPAMEFGRHQRICETRAFCHQHMSFFRFLKELIIKANADISRRHRHHLKEAARAEYLSTLLEDETLTPEVRTGVLGIATETKRRAEDLEALKEAKSEGIVFSESIPIDVIKDTMKGLNSKISARQIIYEYLADNGKLNDQVKERINNRLKKKDFLTNKELLCNPQLFNKIIQVRVVTGYKERAQRYYLMLERHFNDPSAFKCPFCSKYILDVKAHIGRCDEFKQCFDVDKETSIKKYLDTCYKSKGEQREYFINYYKQYGVSYFIDTIGTHIQNRDAFREKIEAGKRQFAKETSKPFNPSEMVKEVNEWIPIKKAKEKVDPPNQQEEQEDFQAVKHLFIDSDVDADEEMESEDCESHSLSEQPVPDHADLVKTMKSFLKIKKK